MIILKGDSMINFVKSSTNELNLVMRIRIEMLKVVNNLSEDTVFSQAFMKSTEEYFKNGNQSTLLAIDDVDNEVIGCATICYIKLMPTFDHPSGNRAHVMNVYTRSTYRRQGIALKMMNMLIEEAKQNGVTEISLDATESGRFLYEKMGFIHTDEGMILNLN